MSIRHLSYVACDECGDPAQPGDDAEEARGISRTEGYARIEGRDLCHPCRHPVALPGCGRCQSPRRR